MLCQNCKKREATVHRTETVNGQLCESHLCAQCAAYTYGEFEKNVGNAVKAGLFGEEPRGEKVCPVCGTRFTDFEKTGLLGCPSCYDVFKTELLPHIARIQGKVKHTGKDGGVYTSEHDLRIQTTSLQDELEAALKGRDYARAGRIHEQLDAIKKKLAGKTDD